ncbi:MAG: hypothetical protein IJ252_11960 [Solobacterium sp.]|nr:hypothetical protein [Solobacterium sp.]
MGNNKAVWIWYPGDMEIYHGMLQNFQREERSYDWPAYWKMDDWRKNVSFTHEYNLEKEETFTVTALGKGYVLVDGKKEPFFKELRCPEGKHTISVFVGNMSSLPAAYIDGETIHSDSTWLADDFEEALPAGTSALYTEKEKDPSRLWYSEERVMPVSCRPFKGGTLFDYGRMVNGVLNIAFPENNESITVCYGESETEALDTEMCYYKQEHVQPGTFIRRRAFRYLFVPEVQDEKLMICAVHQFIPVSVRSSFSTEDEKLQKIWDISAETMKLCSGLFFIDGIKRDRWIWSGDAYQNYFVNPYLFYDKSIDQRTILALRGNMNMSQHINTILDYSLLWIISVGREYETYGDAEFVKSIFPKMEDLMRLCADQLDKNGFIVGRKRDWTYVDWADIDKEGPVCAEQVLLSRCYSVMAQCSELCGINPAQWKKAAGELREKITAYFWNEEKGAFIDSFESGKNHISRQSNIWAVLFGAADEKQKQSIVENVLFNDAVPAITTPYFKFYELDVLGSLGYYDKVMENIMSYWGGMVDMGAVTFWEEYDPRKKEDEQYEMYGDPYGKSLCHGWAASPIYLIARYFIGLKPVSAGYQTYTVEPHLQCMPDFKAELPVRDGYVEIKWEKGKLTIRDHAGGYEKSDVIKACL